MATAVLENSEFSNWLTKKLQELNTDETVFGSYIQSILESDETPDDKTEALQGILAEIIENDSEITKTCGEIFKKWKDMKPKDPIPIQTSDEDLNDKLAKLLESQSLATTKQRQYTDDEKKIREAILSQYSQMIDSEEDEEEASAVGSSGDTKDTLEKNVNAHLVAEAEKQKREQSRLESQRKKDKDKEDREKQKQLKEEKKEKRKTQKGERKR